MKIIRVSTENEMTIHEWPEGDYSQQNHELRRMIGEDCDLYQMVMPRRLYTMLGHKSEPTKIDGEGVVMLVDEEGLLKEHPKMNTLGSYLYEMDLHGSPIVGNILFVGEKLIGGDTDICGISDSTFKKLEIQLKAMLSKVRRG